MSHELIPRDETRAERVGGTILACIFGPLWVYTVFCVIAHETWVWW